MCDYVCVSVVSVHEVGVREKGKGVIRVPFVFLQDCLIPAPLLAKD